MRFIMTLGFILGFLSTTNAGQQYYYDNNGNLVGSSNSFGNQTYYYGQNGEDAGSAMRAGKNTFYYDGNGNSLGSSTNIPTIGKDND